MPPLTAIRAFEAAARLESFTAAGTELGMTQAAVSYQVKALEARLGAALFLRQRGRVVLTPLGKRLLPTLSGAFDAMEQAFATTREEDAALLTVATTFTFANTWLAWRLGGFQVEHPDLAVRLATDNRLIDLIAGEADIAIRAGMGPWPGLEAEPLMPFDFTPMCAPSCLARVEAALGRALAPADLTTQPLIGPGDDWWDVWFAAAGFDSAARPRHAGLRLDSQADEGHAAMGGQGFALLTPALWKNDLAVGRLVQPFALTASAGYRYWLVVAPGRRGVPKIKRFREWVMAQAAARAA
jgi:LysR family glycine cleavage system transcriptional activator